jgi:hypothetical protein
MVLARGDQSRLSTQVGRPHEVWRQLFESAEREIGIFAYSGLFLAEDVGLLHAFADKARAGARVRIALGDPDSPRVAERGAEEGIGDAMAAKICNAITLYRPLLDVSNVEIRLHRTTLYNSLYQADNDLLVNQHAYGIPAANAPVFHLVGGEGSMLSSYIQLRAGLVGLPTVRVTQLDGSVYLKPPRASLMPRSTGPNAAGAMWCSGADEVEVTSCVSRHRTRVSSRQQRSRPDLRTISGHRWSTGIRHLHRPQPGH